MLLAAPALAVSDPAELLPDRQQELRAEALGHQLRCLVCQNESVEESNADLARDLRRIIRQRVVAGDSDQQVIDWMVARYGNFVRLRPPFNATTLCCGARRALALLAGACGGGCIARRRRPAPARAAQRCGTTAAGRSAEVVIWLALVLLAAVALAPLALSLRRTAAARSRREAAIALHRAQLGRTGPRPGRRPHRRRGACQRSAGGAAPAARRGRRQPRGAAHQLALRRADRAAAGSDRRFRAVSALAAHRACRRCRWPTASPRRRARRRRRPR